MTRVDPQGLKARVCCRRLKYIGWITRIRHCFIDSDTDGTWGLFGNTGEGVIDWNKKDDKDKFDKPKKSKCGKWKDDCEVDGCVKLAAESYPDPSVYRFARGPNSNTFAGTIAGTCKLKKPRFTIAPGWKDEQAESSK